MEKKQGKERGRLRTYSAEARAARDGRKNPEAERIDRELRARLAEELGEPVTWRMRGDEPVGISRINAHFFAALFAATCEGVLFEQDEGRLYTYRPERGLWKVRTEAENIGDLSRFMLAEGRREGFEDLLPRRGLTLDREIAAYLKGLVGRRRVFDKEPDASERFIHFRNGVYVIRKGKPEGFRPDFRREDYSRNQIPVDYREDADCPRLIAELLGPALPPETAKEDMGLFFRFLGLFLLGVNLPQRLLILDGAAGAGKSTLAKLAGLLVGRENVAQLRTKQLGERFELFAFLGKTLLLGADASPKFLLTPGAEVLKTLVGGDLLQAEAKQGNDRPSFLGTFNVCINTNSQLRVKISEDVDAWRRRLAVITFQEHRPKKVIPSFERVLFEAEGAGIANRALAGLHEILDAGGSLDLSPAQLRRVEDLLERSEPLAEFLRDRVRKEEGSQVTKRALRDCFKDYCRERRWTLPSDREIGSRLPELMRELFESAESNSFRDPDTGKNVQGYRGVGWITD